MGPRILLHAGFHKTGTSSIQQALRAHADRMAPHCRVRLAEGETGRVLIEAARLFSRQPGIPARRMFRRSLAAWIAPLDLAEGQRLILSCEDLAGHMPGHPGIDGYVRAPRLAAAALTVLADRWPGAEVWLVYGTRAPAAWLRSVYWQQAQHPHLTESPDAFAERLASAADFTALLASIGAECGVPVIGLSLERHGARRLGPVEALYDLMDLPAALRDGLDPTPAANRGGDPHLAEALVALNRQGFAPDALTAAKRALLRGSGGCA